MYPRTGTRRHEPSPCTGTQSEYLYAMAMQANEAVEGKVVAEPATNLKAATATTNLKPATATKLEESLNHL